MQCIILYVWLLGHLPVPTRANEQITEVITLIPIDHLGNLNFEVCSINNKALLITYVIV